MVNNQSTHKIDPDIFIAMDLFGKACIIQLKISFTITKILDFHEDKVTTLEVWGDTDIIC